MLARLTATPARHGALLALLILPGSMMLVFPAMLVCNTFVPSFSDWMGPWLFYAWVSLFCAVGGWFWGRRMAGLADRMDDVRRWAVCGALGFGLTAPAASYGLTAVETDLLNRALDGHPSPMHLAFGAAFGGAVLLVVGGTGLAMGIAARRGLGALKVSAIAGGAATAAFLAVDLGFDLAGWRVGGPGAEARYNMMTVFILGMGLATAVGGAMLGRIFAPRPAAGGDVPPPPRIHTPEAEPAAV